MHCPASKIPVGLLKLMTVTTLTTVTTYESPTPNPVPQRGEIPSHYRTPPSDWTAHYKVKHPGISQSLVTKGPYAVTRLRSSVATRFPMMQGYVRLLHFPD